MSPAMLAIFDLDGTLIDSRSDLAGAVNAARRLDGLEPLPEAAIVKMIGNGLGNLVRRAYAGDPGFDTDRALKNLKAYYQQHLLDRTILYDGVREMLKTLQTAGVICTVLTNKTGVATVAILQGLGVAESIAAVIGDGDGYPLKPAPDAVLALMRKFAAVPETTWVIGDNYTDLASGRAAGCRRLLVRYGFGSPREETADAEAADPAEVAAIILKGVPA